MVPRSVEIKPCVGKAVCIMFLFTSYGSTKDDKSTVMHEIEEGVNALRVPEDSLSSHIVRLQSHGTLGKFFLEDFSRNFLLYP